MPKSVLTVVSLLTDPSLQTAVGRWLQGQHRYRLQAVTLSGDPAAHLERLRDSADVVLLAQGQLPPEAASLLRQRGLLLPAVVIGKMQGRVDYHADEVHLPPDQLEQLTYSLDAAIARFLSHGLEPAAAPSAGGADGSSATLERADDAQMPERWRLANRLQARLGLIGVFYKRDPSRFLRNLPQGERKQLLASLERTYRDLLLSYFRDPAAANQALESFVNTAFFGDLPASEVVEIHVRLIEAFSSQLRLEGRQSDFLQDYRLVLLDVMAHLCEMYRRSMPVDAPLRGAEAAGDLI